MYTRGRGRSSTGAAEAQDLGIAALAWLADDAERLERFLALSGLGPENLRSAAAEPGFLGAVLDHLATNENLLIAFAEHRNVAPETIMRARALLTGRDSQDGS